MADLEISYFFVLPGMAKHGKNVLVVRGLFCYLATFPLASQLSARAFGERTFTK